VLPLLCGCSVLHAPRIATVAAIASIFIGLLAILHSPAFENAY
jgi:hypothetical protein